MAVLDHDEHYQHVLHSAADASDRFACAKFCLFWVGFLGLIALSSYLFTII